MVWINGILQGHGLGILHMGRVTLVQTHVVFVVNLLGAPFRTGAAGNAFVCVDVSGVRSDAYGKISANAGYFLNFGKSEKLNVDVPADLDQFG